MSTSRLFRQLREDAHLSWRRFRYRLVRPRLWPWVKISIGAVTAVGLTGLGMHYEQQRRQRLKEHRVFTVGSPLQNIEDSLRTGDIILFNRQIFAPGESSLHPLRMALVLLQKLHGRSEYDHIGVIIKRHDYPFVLERNLDGYITLRPFDARLLHSASDEFVLRRLVAPAMTPEDEQRMEEWIQGLMGERDDPSKYGHVVVSTAAPRIPPFTLFRHLVAAKLFSSFGTTSVATSNSIATLGRLIQLSAEFNAVDQHLAELAAKQGVPVESLKLTPGSPSSTQRFLIKRKGLRSDIDELLRQYRQDQKALPSRSSSSLTPDQELTRVSDFPSATLVAQALQVLGVLPDRNRLTSQLQVKLTPELTLPSNQIPSSTAYPVRQFLSSSSLPLIHLPLSPSKFASTPHADCFLDREMFLKTKHKSLPFAIEEY